jgi:hypothetical protein
MIHIGRRYYIMARRPLPQDTSCDHPFVIHFGHIVFRVHIVRLFYRVQGACL